MAFDVRAWVASQTKTSRQDLTPKAGAIAGSTEYSIDGQTVAVVHETRSRTADTGPGPRPRTLLALEVPGRSDLEIVLAADVNLSW
jgi:hypothetical protein